MIMPLPPRSTPSELRDEIESWMETPLLQVALDALGGFVVVLNPSRQVLAVSPELAEHLGLQDARAALGLRPGEVFGCLQATKGHDGCQTSPHCPECGAFVAMNQAIARQESVTGECHLECRRNGRFSLREFRIKATPLTLEDESFLVVVLHDISEERRKALLERAFLHDLANTLQGLQAALARESQPMAARRVLDLTHRLGEELQNHRLIMEVEEGRMAPRHQALLTSEVLGTLATHFQAHPAARDRRLLLEDRSPAMVHTDPVLLHRVLTNMVLNAMEASAQGDTVLLWTSGTSDQVTFHIHNDQCIDPEVAALLFKKAVSTKRGNARGLGTYAMRLIGEELLEGKVGFQTGIKEGTTFYISLPIMRN